MSSRLFRPGDRPLLNGALLALTAITTFTTFLFNFGSGSTLPEAMQGAGIFSASLIFILGSHEMGHYVLARIHRVESSLPYFIPLPLLGVGTLGAVIRIRGRIPHRNALVDIGAAGPIAGLLVAIPLLVLGILHSTVIDAPIQPSSFLGESSLVRLLQHLWQVFVSRSAGAAVHSGSGTSLMFGDNLLTLLLQRLLKGPLPEGQDLAVHPLFIAGWFGLLVTMLNLIPIGQLDGGHLSYAVFGERARWIGKAMALLMLGLSVFYSAGWLLWLIVTAKFIGFRHPEPVEPLASLSPARRAICAACLVAFVLCVMPVPIAIVSVR